MAVNPKARSRRSSQLTTAPCFLPHRLLAEKHKISPALFSLCLSPNLPLISLPFNHHRNHGNPRSTPAANPHPSSSLRRSPPSRRRYTLKRNAKNTPLILQSRRDVSPQRDLQLHDKVQRTLRLPLLHPRRTPHQSPPNDQHIRRLREIHGQPRVGSDGSPQEPRHDVPNIELLHQHFAQHVLVGKPTVRRSQHSSLQERAGTRMPMSRDRRLEW